MFIPITLVGFSTAATASGIVRAFVDHTSFWYNFVFAILIIAVSYTHLRPGIIIGKGGQEVDKLKEELKKITDKDIQINIFEVKRPERCV